MFNLSVPSHHCMALPAYGNSTLTELRPHVALNDGVEV